MLFEKRSRSACGLEALTFLTSTLRLRVSLLIDSPLSASLFLPHLVAIHKPSLPGIYSHLRAVSEMQLAQNIADMTFHRIFADNQFLGDLAVGHAVGDQAQNVQLTFGQLGK